MKQQPLARSALGWVMLIVMIGFVEILVVRTIVEFPMTLDHAFFLPASYFDRNTGILNNPWRSPFPSRILNWHGFMQPALVADLSFDRSWQATFLALDVLAVSALASVAAALLWLRIEALRSAAVMLVTLSLILDYRARPEVLASMLVLALVLLIIRSRENLLSSHSAAGGSGAILALLFCSHPAIFLLCGVGLAFAITLALSTNPGVCSADLLRFLSIAAVVMIVILALCFGLVYRASPLAYLHGIAEHTRKTANRHDPGFFFEMFVANRFIPLLALGLLMAPLASWTLLQRVRVEEQAARLWRTISAVVAVAGLLLLYRLAVRIPSTYYNFSGLLPALLVGCAFLFAGKAARANGRIVWPVAIYLLALGGLATGSLVGQLLWLQQNAAEGRAAVTNRSALGEAMRASLAGGRKTCGDLAAISAAPNFDVARQVRFLAPTGPSPRSPQSRLCDVYFAVATEAGDRVAPEIVGYSLTLDRFPTSKPLLPVRPLDMRFARYELAAAAP